MRFVTLQTVQQLFAQAGLSILECRANITPYPDHSLWEQVLAPAVRQLGRDFQQFQLESSAFQYLILAAKPAAAPSVAQS